MLNVHGRVRLAMGGDILLHDFFLTGLPGAEGPGLYPCSQLPKTQGGVEFRQSLVQTAAQIIHEFKLTKVLVRQPLVCNNSFTIFVRTVAGIS